MHDGNVYGLFTTIVTQTVILAITIRVFRIVMRKNNHFGLPAVTNDVPLRYLCYNSVEEVYTDIYSRDHYGPRVTGIVIYIPCMRKTTRFRFTGDRKTLKKRQRLFFCIQSIMMANWPSDLRTTSQRGLSMFLCHTTIVRFGIPFIVFFASMTPAVLTAIASWSSVLLNWTRLSLSLFLKLRATIESCNNKE